MSSKVNNLPFKNPPYHPHPCDTKLLRYGSDLKCDSKSVYWRFLNDRYLKTHGLLELLLSKLYIHDPSNHANMSFAKIVIFDKIIKSIKPNGNSVSVA